MNTLLDYEDHNGRELQNIARNHSADIYCKDFMKIYREWTREPFDFFTIDATLSASNPLRWENIYSNLYKKEINWWT